MASAHESPQLAKTSPEQLRIHLACDRAINFAFQQNSIPIVSELRIENTGLDLDDFTVRIWTEPPFALPLELHGDKLGLGQEFRIAPVDLKLSPEFLANLEEKITGLIHVEVRNHTGPLATHAEQIDLLAPNEWCGLVCLPEILAAFVLPNDPAVMRILARASEILGEHTGRSALNGYQDKSRRRAWEQLAAIYKAIAELRLRYINPPASFEETGQKVRFPRDIIDQRFATCLDLALLVAACCEQSGLHPLVLLQKGHAYAGCWLEDRTFDEPATDDLQRVRKLVELESITVFETTALTSDRATTLEDAERLAKPHLEPAIEFRHALDIRRARMARIHPLPVAGEIASDTPQPASRPDAEGLGQRAFAPSVQPPAPAPQRPATRIDQWKSRLLDLSLRNRLLNFRATKSSIPILTAAPEQLEDQLASATELALHPRPKMMNDGDPRDAATYLRQHNADAIAEHLRAELAHGRLRTGIAEPDHTRRLTDLYRSARVSLEENGTNTLYAAVGILEWRETEHSDRTFRAPLLLVPVELKRRSVIEGFVLRRLDEDTRLNVTLMEMLRQHFQKEIAGLDPLPEDASGVNVTEVFRIFREAVRDLPGWELKTEVWLGEFSFTKFLLWKDLSDRLDALARNRVVNHLVNDAGLPFPNPPQDIHADQLDRQFHPREVYCPRSADSSQLAAVLAAAAGHDFVLEGPPGTGKSQTITNIIAHCLAHGKRVLFVAEKRAALDVVHRRLKDEGLAPFCLELHSNKTGKAEALAQFDDALRFLANEPASDWNARAEKLEKLRAELNNYKDALHQPRACGLSAFDCIDYLLPRRGEHTVALTIPNIADLPAETLVQCRDLTRTLQERARELIPLSTHPLAPIGLEEWSSKIADSSLAALLQLATLATTADRATLDVKAFLKLSSSLSSRPDLNALRDLAESLLNAEPVAPTFVTTPWQQLSTDLDAWTTLIAERQTLRAKLAGYDEAKLTSLNLGELLAKHQSAQTAWFLPKWLALRKIRATLQAARTNATSENLAELLPAAIRIHDINKTLAAANPASTLGKAWSNGEPSGDALRRARAWGDQLNARIFAIAKDDLALLAQLRQIIATIITEGPAALSRVTAFRDKLQSFDAAFDSLANDLVLNREHFESDHFAQVTSFAQNAPAAWPQLRAWASWRKARTEANALHLGPIIAHLEAAPAPVNDLPDLLERSFRRALLNHLIEAEPALRNFFGREHAERIDRFRATDDEVAGLARALIRSRLAAKTPRENLPDDVPKAELGLLRKEIGKKARHIPVRQLLGRIPKLLPLLKPCVLMSPLSVAQYLEPSHEQFDIVIFDEASQIPVWDSVGAIARGKQLIVVGDPKQLPPTNFFNPSEDPDDESLLEQEDLESILDELLTHGLRHKRLQWHYRSRNEGLIAFSNRFYYGNELLTFPAPRAGYSGVRFVHLPQARYDKGRTRTNPAEGRALVDELVRRLRANENPPRSYGVVTFSMAQQQLVENLLDEERRKFPEIEAHFGDTPPVQSEPVFVKNLENVQGDERDVILFSVCYGPDESGRISMNFGPLNREGGERRLNVAVTRAKHEILIFSSLRGDQIDLSRSRARGVRDLRFFLEYAERGPTALASDAQSNSAAAPTKSEFVEMIAAKLREAGHSVHTNVGCSGYRVDVAVVDPRDPARYLLGLECDGPFYKRAATARDRDKLRHEVLKSLGWTLHRLWSPDWWHNPEKEIKSLLAAVSSAGSA